MNLVSHEALVFGNTLCIQYCLHSIRPLKVKSTFVVFMCSCILAFGYLACSCQTSSQYSRTLLRYSRGLALVSMQRAIACCFILDSCTLSFAAS